VTLSTLSTPGFCLSYAGILFSLGFGFLLAYVRCDVLEMLACLRAVVCRTVVHGCLAAWCMHACVHACVHASMRVHACACRCARACCMCGCGWAGGCMGQSETAPFRDSISKSMNITLKSLLPEFSSALEGWVGGWGDGGKNSKSWTGNRGHTFHSFRNVPRLPRGDTHS
jgi:hypothetical protein